VTIYKKGDKTNCCNYGIISLVSYNQNFIQHPAVMVNFICRGNYWGSSVLMLRQQVSCWSYSMYSSITLEKIGKQ
jgi:hypothetical protein